MEQLNHRILAHIPLTGLINARHLGGYHTADGHLTREGAFVRCENPQHMTQEDMNQLYRFGIRSVIDLRSAEEIESAPNPMASDNRFTYCNIPVFQTDASPSALTKSGIAMGKLYIHMLKDCKESFRSIFKQILDARGGVLFHCSAGKDRTGVLSALLLSLVGVDEDTVIREYTYTQTLLAPLVEKLKRTLPDGISGKHAEDMLAARPEYIKEALNYLKESYGSAEGYLLSLGFRTDEVEALRQKLVAQESEQEKGA